MTDENLSPHFSRSELACPCCGTCELDERLLPALEQLRALAGEPVIIDSCYRCAKHNAGAFGVPKSAHMKGKAADIKIAGKTLQELYDLAESVKDFREGGIGCYDDGFVHVDVRLYRARWARVKGVYVSLERSGLLTRW